jgi:N-acetylmuramic acid 6-phosphate etherase
MIDVAVTNSKLHDRALRMLQDLTDLDRPAANDLLEASGRSVKLALLMHWTKIDQVDGQKLLAAHQGQLRLALAAAKQS